MMLSTVTQDVSQHHVELIVSTMEFIVSTEETYETMYEETYILLMLHT